MTRTYVEMGVSQACFDEIKRSLAHHGYDYLVHGDNQPEAITLDSIALVPTPPELDVQKMKNGMTYKEILIDYTNHRGERRWRTVTPIHIFFGRSEYHDRSLHECTTARDHWYMLAMDREKGDTRTFAISDIHEIIGYSGA